MTAESVARAAVEEKYAVTAVAAVAVAAAAVAVVAVAAAVAAVAAAVVAAAAVVVAVEAVDVGEAVGVVAAIVDLGAWAFVSLPLEAGRWLEWLRGRGRGAALGAKWLHWAQPFPVA